MSGNAGIRGYIIQTIICVLDALEKDNEWISVTLEPIYESEKVDIKWEYPKNVIKVCQVKSSENVIRYSKAKHWCDDLINTTPNANLHELVVVGHPDQKLLKSETINNVKIVGFKNIDTQDLINEASTKIDSYYERKGKTKISSKVREILVKTLTMYFGTNSIIGIEISRDDFDVQLLEWISAIELQIEVNPFASLATPTTEDNAPFNHRIAKKIIELIGWNNFNENISVEIFNQRTSENDTHEINFFGDFESKLKENTDDVILITSLYDLAYPESSKNQIAKYLYDSDKVFEDLKHRKIIPPLRHSDCEYHNILFWLTTENSEIRTDFIQHAKENFKKELLKDNLTYYLVDNNKVNFLVSTIVTAKNYRNELAVKFLYPITEANQNPGQIGKRGQKLPAQYINSSVIPIIKESSDKISILLFCSDPFTETSLKKLIWLTIRLTSGLGNEYIIYFPDYVESVNKNSAVEVIRSFNDEILEARIKIRKYESIDTKAFDSIPNPSTGFSKIEHYDETQEATNLKSKHLNEAFINILPYGDILKPFLKTDAITANDIKIFLAKKGIFVKNADRKKLISLMSSLLFSPKDLEDFKALIDIKDRQLNTTNEIFQIKENDTLGNVFKKIKPNFDNVAEGLSTKLLAPTLFKINPDNSNEFVLEVITEHKDPTSQISVNTVWGKIEVICTKENDTIIVNRINTVSREDKLIANRIIKVLENEFKRVDFVKEETVKVMFKSFKTNTERVNFLYSYTDVTSSSIFKEPDIKSIKFKFDDTQDIPEKVKDKEGKDIITYLSGRNLAEVDEMADSDFKKALLLEEVYISYKFDYLNIKNSYYSVKFNFSDALKNKPEKDGAFKSEPNLYMSSKIKTLTNIDHLKKELSKEIERIKLEKLKKFNIIE